MIKNFSDFSSRQILKGIPKKQRVIAVSSRAIGDQNRPAPKYEEQDGRFRKIDFKNHPIWKNGEELTPEEQGKLSEDYYEPYHEEVINTIKRVEDNNMDKRIIIFDIHDTGNLMLDPDPRKDRKRENTYPQINVGDKFGSSSHPEITKFFINKLEEYLLATGQYDNLKINYNDPPEKAYVVTKYGKDHNDQFADDDERKFQRSAIQIEINRSFLMDEKTQIPKHPKVLKVFSEAMQKAMRDTADEFASLDRQLAPQVEV